MTDLVYTPRMGGIQRGDKRGLNNKERTKIALARDGEKPAPEPRGDGKWLRSDVWKPLPNSKPVGLMEGTGCAWSVGNTLPQQFCNLPTIGRSCYCEQHENRYWKKEPTK